LQRASNRRSYIGARLCPAALLPDTAPERVVQPLVTNELYRNQKLIFAPNCNVRGIAVAT